MLSIYEPYLNHIWRLDGGAPAQPRPGTATLTAHPLWHYSCSAASMISQPSRPLISAPAVLSLLCLALAGGLAYRYRLASSEKEHQVTTINYYSNQWVQTSHQLREQKLVNLALERTYANRADELTAYSNTVEAVTSEASGIEARSRAANQAAQALVARQDARIAELESERESMSRDLSSLTESISNLETQIAATEQKLVSSTADRAYLMAELKRLQEEKADLERRFTDLALLRQHMRQLRQDLSINRRLAWLRRGLHTEAKGAEILRSGLASASSPGKFNLDVEVRRDQNARGLSPTP